MDIHQVTISEVKDLLKVQELKLTNQMNKQIRVRVKEEVDRQIEQKDKEIGGKYII